MLRRVFTPKLNVLSIKRTGPLEITSRHVKLPSQNRRRSSRALPSSSRFR